MCIRDRASASFAADILSNSSSFAARDTLSEATSSKILNGELEFTNITASNNISASGDLSIGGVSIFDGHITASGAVSLNNKVFVNNILSSSVDSQMDLQGKIFVHTGSIVGDLHIRTNEDVMRFGKSTSGLIVSASENISRFATGSDGSTIDLGFTTTDEDGNEVLLTTGDGIHLESSNYWYTTGHFKLGDSNNFINWDTSNLTVSGTFNGDGSGLSGLPQSFTNVTSSGNALFQSDVKINDSIVKYKHHACY